MGLEEEDHKGKVPFHHIVSTVQAIIDRIIIEDVNADHLVELVYVRFFYHKVTFLLCILYNILWKEADVNNPPLRSGEYLHILFKIRNSSAWEMSILPTYVFMYSVIYLYQ